MQSNDTNYELLISKLKEFKRKYYRNKIIKGLIYFSAVLLVSYLLVTVLEYFGRFDTTTRTVLFYTFILVNAAILYRYILLPLLSLYELRKNLSYDQAANIIGQHFSEVKDKLLNTIQLHEQAVKQEPGQRTLIEASINQKIAELRPVPFLSAVDYRRNRRYLKYALIPLAALLILMLRAPYMLVESTERLVAHNRYFEEKAPFSFELVNDSLTAIRQQDFTVNLKVKGQELPAEVYIMVDGSPFRMSGKSKNDWNYTLKNLQRDVVLRFNGGGFTSRPYTLRVLPRPLLQKFEVKLSYPAYIGKKDEVLQNMGDLSIPAGTEVTWKFYTDNTDDISLSFGRNNKAAERKGENMFIYKSRFTEDDNYVVRTGNKYVRSGDSIQYQINVIPDAYPYIRVEEAQDSTRLKNMYFTGEVSDDYGFTRLSFRYHFSKTDDSAKMHQPEKSQNIAISRGRLLQSFYHFWDLNDLNIKPGDEMEYYFEVWDNDGVHGPKSARSQRFYFRAPTLDEIEKNAEAGNQEMKTKMESALRTASQLQKDMQNARMKLIDKKNLDWQDKKLVDDILKKQEELQKKVDDIQKDYKKNLDQQTEFKEMDKALLEKHKELQEMFDKVLDEKTKKMFEELQKLLEQNRKEDIQQKLDEMKFQDKEVQKELNRMMELFKQLEFEQKLDETVDKLDKLKEEQEKLSEETDKKGADAKELQQKQEELNKKFEDLKKSLDELEKKNEELENKNDMEKTDQEQQDIQNEMEQSGKNLQDQKNKKAAQNQKNAAEKMDKLSKKLKNMQQDMEKEAHEEDYQSLRQILENLVYVSLEQEKLMDQFRSINSYNPQYIELAQRQRKLKEDAKLIEDSLLALSKRVVEIKSFVNKEIGEVNFNMEKALAALADRNTPLARQHEQFTMTSLNNLALMLSEVMQQMQQNMQMQMKMGANGGKPKPKKGQQQGPSMKKLRELQQQLGQQIQDLKNGKMNSQQQGQQMSKQLAEMAAQQEMIRRELQKMQDKLNKDGHKSLGDLDKIQQEMDKTEEDLVNKRITDETIKRQQDIVTRMLESEKSEREQDQDQERKSETAKNEKNPTPPMLEKYLRMKEEEVELLRTVPPSLNPYYREKVKEYFQQLK